MAAPTIPANESRGARPFDVAGAPMTEQVGKSICGDGKDASAYGDMRVGDINDIKKERHSKNRTAPTNQSEREPDGTA